MAVSHSAFSASHAEQALRFVGKSTDAKPGEAGCKYPAPPNASTFYEMDGNNRFWMYDAEDGVWILQNTGGGPGPSITIDPTLSIEGAAADAKAVGVKMVWKPEDYVEGELLVFDADGNLISSGISANGVTNKVDYSIAQTLTDTQKQQARDNIAAAGRVEVEPLINQWDERWEVGGIDAATGINAASSTVFRGVSYIPVIPGANYYLNAPVGNNTYFRCYDANKMYLGYNHGYINSVSGSRLITIPSDTFFIRICHDGTTYNHDISINYPATYTGYYPAGLSKVEADRINNDTMLAMDGYISPVINGVGNYKIGNEYHKRICRVDLGTLNWSYSQYFMTSNLQVIAKKPLNENTLANIYCDRFKLGTWNGIVIGRSNHSIAMASTGNVAVLETSYTDANAFKAAMQGVYLYYELAAEEVRNIDGTEIGDSLGKLGNAIVSGGWNQLAHGDFVDSSNWSCGSGDTLSVSGGVLSITRGTGGNFYARSNSMVGYKQGHKYFYSEDIKANTDVAVRLTLNNQTLSAIAVTSGWQRIAGIITAGTPYVGANNIVLAYVSSAGATAGLRIDIKNFMLIDLTEIFGAGNEPSIEQFKQLFPGDYYPYALPMGKAELEEAINTNGFGEKSGSRNLLNPDPSKRISYGAYSYVYLAEGALRVRIEDNDTSVNLSGISFGFVKDIFNVLDAYVWIIYEGVLRSERNNIATAGSGSGSGQRCPYIFVYPDTQIAWEKIFQRYHILVEQGTGSEAGPYVPFFYSNKQLEVLPWGDLLWENASPTSAFAAQTMSVGISDYKFVMLIYRLSANDATNFLTELVPVGKKRDVICFSGGTIKMRSVTPTAGNAVIFNDARNYTAYGNASSYTVDNSILIPVSIYGIR